MAARHGINVLWRPVELHPAMRRISGLRGTLSNYGMTECPGVTAISLSDSADSDLDLPTDARHSQRK
ncbi:MAG TPA: hypothetical protein VHC18_11795 [Amycolatopsis sp.]|nr:hypothetical protein [Amycolatopsis sp.]